ncbi:major royal jelly protein-domain-containing protein [Paraphoma chrysanthemicola]|uniref:Major royal jelly protein-domain-containing protein n=1 Tax=Paraphoma chrysanthemicola TaxID=798071 RepID=A0A8K0R7R8_9PLEO|nr:major royal jelly protein-domain-containing protein [Paraphoma chrysanthemicola]
MADGYFKALHYCGRSSDPRTGITVSRSGRKFSNYPAGLDSNNTNTGNNNKYQVAEVIGNSTEKPYPNAEINNPPGGAVNYTTTPPTGANYQNYLIGVQSVVLDPLDRLWILDTGRGQLADGTLVLATYGGPKLVGVDISSNTVIKTIVFPPTVAFPDSYLNDIRFDLRASVSASGQGVAYITDSSSEGRNGIIIVDLGTGESWRHLDNIPEVSAERGFVPYVWGQPLYYIPRPGQPLTTVPLGSDGITLSADGDDLYFGPVGGRGLYSVPTARLRERGQASELLAQAAVVDRGQRGVSDGFETDTNGFIYAGNMEQNEIGFYNPANATMNVLVRDPRISWVDTMSVANDGYLYFTDNQLAFSKAFYPGTDRRQRPFVLFRIKLPGNGTRVDLQ